LRFAFYHLESIKEKTKAMCCKRVSRKNHDENKCRRDGVGSKQKGDDQLGRWNFAYVGKYQIECRNLYLEIIFISCCPLLKTCSLKKFLKGRRK